MTEITLVLGTKNLSSWSMRPWMLARHLGVPFREELIELDQPGSAAQRLADALGAKELPAGDKAGR